MQFKAQILSIDRNDGSNDVEPAANDDDVEPADDEQTAAESSVSIVVIDCLRVSVMEKGISDCRCPHLEQSAGRCNFCALLTVFRHHLKTVLFHCCYKHHLNFSTYFSGPYLINYFDCFL